MRQQMRTTKKTLHGAEILSEKTHIDGNIYYTQGSSDTVHRLGMMSEFKKNQSRLLGHLFQDRRVKEPETEDNEDPFGFEEVATSKLVVAEMFRLGIFVEKNFLAAEEIQKRMKDKEKEVALDLALITFIKEKHADAVASLIQQGAYPLAVDDDGGSALHLAAIPGNEEVLRVLLKSTISPSDEKWVETAKNQAQHNNPLAVEILIYRLEEYKKKKR